MEVLLDIVPTNPVKAMADEKMLQIILFAMLTGVTATLLKGHQFNVMNDFLVSGTSLMLLMIGLVMKLAPYGAFCLIARVVSLQGADVLINLGAYVLTLLFVLLFHVIVIYGSFLRLLAGLSFTKFLSKFWPVMAVAFTTSSSNATIPVNIETCEKKLGVSNSVTSFTIPFGATVNMDGTAIMQGVAAIFVAQLYGLTLDLSGQVQIVITCVLASIGTAGVPGVGLVMLAMVFQQAGLPLEAIGLLWSVDRLIDMSRTVVNITGDAVGTVLVAVSENEFDRSVYGR